MSLKIVGYKVKVILRNSPNKNGLVKKVFCFEHQLEAIDFLGLAKAAGFFAEMHEITVPTFTNFDEATETLDKAADMLNKGKPAGEVQRFLHFG